MQDGAFSNLTRMNAETKAFEMSSGHKGKNYYAAKMPNSDKWEVKKS